MLCKVFPARDLELDGWFCVIYVSVCTTNGLSDQLICFAVKTESVSISCSQRRSQVDLSASKCTTVACVTAMHCGVKSVKLKENISAICKVSEPASFCSQVKT